MIKINSTYSISGRTSITASSNTPIYSITFYVIKVQDDNYIERYKVNDVKTDHSSLPGLKGYKTVTGKTWNFQIEETGIYLIIGKTSTDVGYQITQINTQIGVRTYKLQNESERNRNDGSITVVLEGGNPPFTYYLMNDTEELSTLLSDTSFVEEDLEERFTIINKGNTFQRSFNISDLEPGTYKMGVFDAGPQAQIKAFTDFNFRIAPGFNKLKKLELDEVVLEAPSHLGYTDGYIAFILESGVGNVVVNLIHKFTKINLRTTSKTTGDKVVFRDLSSEDYIIRMTDSKNTTVETVVTLPESLNAPLSVTTTPTSPSDYNINNGKIQVDIAGGKMPYTIEFRKVIPVRLRTQFRNDRLVEQVVTEDSVYTLQNLESGLYNIVVKDSARISDRVISKVMIEDYEPTPIDLVSTVIPPTELNGKGTLEVNLSGGTRDQNQNLEITLFEVINGISTFRDRKFNNSNRALWRLKAGNYIVIAKDLISEVTENINIQEYNFTPFEFANEVKSDITCASTESGEFSLEVVDGVEPFEWTVSSNANRNYISIENNTRKLTARQLSIGKYNVSVVDASGHRRQTQVQINNIPGTATITHHILNVGHYNKRNRLGYVHFLIEGGCAPYNAQITNTTTGNVSNIRKPLTNGFVEPFVARNLRAGEYSVTVTDSNNNQTTFEFEILDNIGKNTSIYKYHSTPPTNVSNLNGKINAIIKSSNPPYNYKLTDTVSGSIIVDDTVSTTTYSFLNLEPSIYRLEVTDSSLPSPITEMVLIEVFPYAVELTKANKFTVAKTNETSILAANGTLTVSPDMPTDEFQIYLYDDNRLEVLNSTNPNFVNPLRFPDMIGSIWQNLKPGWYYIIAYFKDANLGNAYIYEKKWIKIEQFPLPDFTMTAQKIKNSDWNQNNGVIEAQVIIDGIGPYTYELLKDGRVIRSNETNSKTQTFENLSSGTYDVRIYDCRNNCNGNSTLLPDDFREPKFVNGIQIKEGFDIVDYKIYDKKIDIILSPVGTGEITSGGFMIYGLKQSDFPTDPADSMLTTFAPNYANPITPPSLPSLSRTYTIELDDFETLYWVMVVDEANNKKSFEANIGKELTLDVTVVPPENGDNVKIIAIGDGGAPPVNYVYTLYDSENQVIESNNTGNFIDLVAGNYVVRLTTNFDFYIEEPVTIISDLTECTTPEIRDRYLIPTSSTYVDSPIDITSVHLSDVWIVTEHRHDFEADLELKYFNSGASVNNIKHVPGVSIAYTSHNYNISGETQLSPNFDFWDDYYSVPSPVVSYKTNLTYAIHCPISKDIAPTYPIIEMLSAANNSGYNEKHHRILNFNTLSQGFNILNDTNNGSISAQIVGGTAPYTVELYKSEAVTYYDNAMNPQTIYTRDPLKDTMVQSLIINNQMTPFTFSQLEGFNYKDNGYDEQSPFYYIRVYDSTGQNLALNGYNSIIGEPTTPTKQGNMNFINYSNPIHIRNNTPWLEAEMLEYKTSTSSMGKIRLKIYNYELTGNRNPIQFTNLYTCDGNNLSGCCPTETQLNPIWQPGSYPNSYYADIDSVNLSCFILNYTENNQDYYITLSPFTLNEIGFTQRPIAPLHFDNETLEISSNISSYREAIEQTSSYNFIEDYDLYTKNEDNKMIVTPIIEGNQGRIRVGLNINATNTKPSSYTFELYKGMSLEASQTYNLTSPPYADVIHDFMVTTPGVYKVSITSGVHKMEEYIRIDNIGNTKN